MQTQSFGDLVVGAGFVIPGATAEEETRMRRLQDRLADAGLGFRAPNHEHTSSI
jgi:hypothetical protein